MANKSSLSNQRSRGGDTSRSGNRAQSGRSFDSGRSGSSSVRGDSVRIDRDRSRGFGHGDEINRYTQPGQSGHPARGRSQSDQGRFGRGNASERHFNSNDWQGGPVQSDRGRDRDDWSVNASQGNAGRGNDPGRHEGSESRFFRRDDEGYVGGIHRSADYGPGNRGPASRSDRDDFGAFDERQGTRFGGSSDYDSYRDSGQAERRDYNDWGNTGRNEQFDPYQASNRREGDAYDSRRGEYEERNRNYGNYAGERGPNYSGSSAIRQDEDYEERGDDYIAGRSRDGSREEPYSSSRGQHDPGRSRARTRP